jgi:hypothetical protein
MKKKQIDLDLETKYEKLKEKYKNLVSNLIRDNRLF